MKFKLIYPALSLAFGALMMSNTNGPSNAGNGNRTGSPISSGTCTFCHGGNAAPGLTVAFKDAQGQVATGYILGRTYTIEITSPATGSTGFGFQAQVVGNGIVRGTLTAGTNQRVQNNIVEHTSRLAAGTYTFTWTAPSTNVGAVNVYVSLLSTNSNGSSSGDNTVTFASDDLYGSAAPVGVEETLQKVSSKLYPVPAVHTLNAEFTNLVPNTYTMEIVSLNGQVLSQKQLDITSQNERVAIPVETLASGMYALRLSHAGAAVHTQTFMKQ